MEDVEAYAPAPSTPVRAAAPTTRPNMVTHPRLTAVAAGANAPQNDGMRKVQSNMELNSRALPTRPQNKVAYICYDIS